MPLSLLGSGLLACVTPQNTHRNHLKPMPPLPFIPPPSNLFHAVGYSLECPGLASEDMNVFENPLQRPEKRLDLYTVPAPFYIRRDAFDLSVKGRVFLNIDENHVRGLQFLPHQTVLSYDAFATGGINPSVAGSLKPDPKFPSCPTS